VRPNLGKKEKWMPFHTVLGVHELFMVQSIHHAAVPCWDARRRFLAVFVFRAHCKAEVFREVQLAHLQREDFWTDPLGKFDPDGSIAREMLMYRRHTRQPLQTLAFRCIPARLCEDDDENLVRNIVLRTQTLLGVAERVWPIVGDDSKNAAVKFGEISREVRKGQGLGETWAKMLMVSIDIAYPKLRLLAEHCDVGVGAMGGLKRLLGTTAAAANAEGATGVKADLERVTAAANASKLPSARHFWDLLPHVERLAQEEYHEFALVLDQTRTPHGGLTVVTMQVQLCEWRQFQQHLKSIRGGSRAPAMGVQQLSAIPANAPVSRKRARVVGLGTDDGAAMTMEGLQGRIAEPIAAGPTVANSCLVQSPAPVEVSLLVGSGANGDDDDDLPLSSLPSAAVSDNAAAPLLVATEIVGTADITHASPSTSCTRRTGGPERCREAFRVVEAALSELADEFSQNVQETDKNLAEYGARHEKAKAKLDEAAAGFIVSNRALQDAEEEVRKAEALASPLQRRRELAKMAVRTLKTEYEKLVRLDAAPGGGTLRALAHCAREGKHAPRLEGPLQTLDMALLELQEGQAYGLARAVEERLQAAVQRKKDALKTRIAQKKADAAQHYKDAAAAEESVQIARDRSSAAIAEFVVAKTRQAEAQSALHEVEERLVEQEKMASESREGQALAGMEYRSVQEVLEGLEREELPRHRAA